VDVKQEIARRIEALPIEMQERVLEFVSSLAAADRKGENGTVLRQFSSTLDAVSAREMSEAISKGCEQIDARDW
jgi:ADP-dependent phosphofructokinase/glucokinase